MEAAHALGQTPPRTVMCFRTSTLWSASLLKGQSCALSWSNGVALAYLLAFCLGSSPSIAAYVAMNALCQAAHVKDGHSKGVAPFCPSGRNTSVKYLCRIPIIALEAPIQLCRAAL
jgi:hypothetical protein